MKKLPNLHKPLNMVRDLAVKRVIKQFAAKYHMVYFGRVDPQDDEFELIRGATVSTTHSDNHYTVGTFQGIDITTVVRRNQLVFPGKEPRNYTWLLMQFDLQKDTLPHVFIDSHHHETTFYANFFLTHTQLQNVSGAFAQYDAIFARKCKVFAAQEDIPLLHALLQNETTATLAHHFSQFDYEIFEDRLLIYASNPLITLPLMTEMLRAGLWLTQQLNTSPVLPSKDTDI